MQTQSIPDYRFIREYRRKSGGGTGTGNRTFTGSAERADSTDSRKHFQRTAECKPGQHIDDNRG